MKSIKSVEEIIYVEDSSGAKDNCNIEINELNNCTQNGLNNSINMNDVNNCTKDNDDNVNNCTQNNLGDDKNNLDDDNVNICNICYDPCVHLHNLPCMHYYCFLCIYRHLQKYDNCPTCLKKYGIYDLTTKCIKNKNNKILITPNLIFKRTIVNYKRILKKYKIDTSGENIDRLGWRFDELVAIMENEKFEKIPKSENAIAWEVHKRERGIFNKKNINKKEIYLALKKLINRIKENK